jgi:hypothetical protein
MIVDEKIVQRPDVAVSAEAMCGRGGVGHPDVAVSAEAMCGRGGVGLESQSDAASEAR